MATASSTPGMPMRWAISSSSPRVRVSLAVGVNWRREKVSGHADPEWPRHRSGDGLTSRQRSELERGVYTDPSRHGRDDSAVYAETRDPDHLGPHGYSGPAPAGAHRRRPLRALQRRRQRHLPRNSASAGSPSTASSPSTAPTPSPSPRRRCIQAYGPYRHTPGRGDRFRSHRVVFGSQYAVNTHSFNGEDGNNPALKPSTAHRRARSASTFRPKFINGLTVDRGLLLDQPLRLRRWHRLQQHLQFRQQPGFGLAVLRQPRARATSPTSAVLIRSPPPDR